MVELFGKSFASSQGRGKRRTKSVPASQRGSLIMEQQQRHSLKERQQQQQQQEETGIGTRSCLAFPRLLQRGPTAAAANGSTASAMNGAPKYKNSESNSDRRGLLGSTESSMAWESFSSPTTPARTAVSQSNSNSNKSPFSWASTAPTADTSTATQSPFPSASRDYLLTPPAPQDRHGRPAARRQYETEQRQKSTNTYSNSNTYPGEMEPAGVRGQQAAVLPPFSPSSGTAEPNYAYTAAAATSATTDPAMHHLLQPPTPSDRSERRRLQYENEKRNATGNNSSVGAAGVGGAAGNGNGEPVGRRGQQAVVAPLPTAAAPSSSLLLLTPPTPSDRRQQRKLRYDNENRPILDQPVSLSPPTMQQSPPTVRLVQTATPKSGVSGITSTRHSTPTGRVVATTLQDEHPDNENDSDNTSDSDVDIRNMRTDWLDNDDDNNNNAGMANQHETTPLQFSTTTGQAVRYGTNGQPIPMQTPNGKRPASQPPQPPSRMSSDGSDISDQDLAYMRSDLMPVQPGTTLRSQPPVQQQHAGVAGLSSVAAAAAAAARHGPQRIWEETDDLTDRAREIATANHENVDALNAAAMQHVQAGEFDAALEAFARVLAIHQTRDGAVHPTVASSYHNLGTVHAKRALQQAEDSTPQLYCRAQALECFQAAARVARDSLGRNHPNVAVSLVRIGFLLLQSRQYQNAIVTFKEALRIRISFYGAHHGLVANLYNNLGVCHMHLGHFGEGREFLDSALGIQRSIANETMGQKKNDRWINLLELADTLFNIGGLCLEWIRRQGPDARRAVDAENAFAEALEIRMRVLGPQDPMVLQVETLLEMARGLPRPWNRSSSPGGHRTEVASGVYQSSTSPNRGRSVPPPGSGYQPVTTSNRGRSMTHTQVTVNDTSTDHAVVVEPPKVRRSPTKDTFGTVASPARSPNVSDLQPSDESTGVNTTADESRTNNGASIFRGGAPNKKEANGSYRETLHDVMTISTDEGEETGNVSSARTTGTTATRIFVSPHLVPETSPSSRSRGRSNNDSEEVIASASFDDDPFTPDTSTEIAGSTSVIQKAFSYDAEENCMISDTGIDSEHGRVHYPIAWNKGRIDGVDGQQGATNGRDIMVTRPYRGSTLARSTSASSEKWGSDTANFTTGNTQRDEVMNRARAILEQHNGPEGPPDEYTGIDDDEVDESLDFGSGSKVRNFDQDLLEDGVAPLGGNWPSSADSGRRTKTVREMLDDPMNHLREIHEEATQLLKTNDFIDSLRLFGVVLECQRRRHGSLHPDVAATLHNVGIAQLRALNYPDALKAFEEAARVRRGSLGRDHPQVAVSLVKVGITLLLIHRFEDALWSFREALSVRKAALGALHPSTARIYNNIGCVHVEFNEFREARRAFEAALDIQRNALSQDPDSGPLMFGAATTLCNLGYLYRYRDMHAKAALVLKEAVDLQESVLGRTHATVLSTLDNLADSCANSGHAADALKYYNMVLERFRVGGRSGSKKVLRAEAVLHYKMSRVHRHRNDRETQLDSLKLALRSVRAYSDSSNTDSAGDDQTDTLERRIQHDIRGAREQIEKEQLKWI